MGISRVSLHNPTEMKVKYLDTSMETVTIDLDQITVFLTLKEFEQITAGLIEFKELIKLRVSK